MSEAGRLDGLFCILYPVERHVTVHGSDKRERAGWTNEPVAMGKETKVFAWVTVGETNLMLRE